MSKLLEPGCPIEIDGALHADYCRAAWDGPCTCAAGPTLEHVASATERSEAKAKRSIAPACWLCRGYQRIGLHEPEDGRFTEVPCPECCQ